jgi:hypothetical protein
MCQFMAVMKMVVRVIVGESYQPGDERSRMRAKQRAEAQGRAAYASGYKGG